MLRGEMRSQETLPDVPTVDESDHKDYDASGSTITGASYTVRSDTDVRARALSWLAKIYAPLTDRSRPRICKCHGARGQSFNTLGRSPTPIADRCKLRINSIFFRIVFLASFTCSWPRTGSKVGRVVRSAGQPPEWVLELSPLRGRASANVVAGSGSRAKRPRQARPVQSDK